MIGVRKMEKVITTRRGVYGRVQVTLPLTVKTSLMELQKKSGMKKAEFLRLAIMTGYLNLSQGIEKNDRSPIPGGELSQQPAWT
jgi:hypothetical protein